MILYVDETENNDFFILTGLLLESEKIADEIYFSFKKKASNYHFSENLKARLFTEFKSTLMDRMFQPLKRKMIEEINKVNNIVIYSIYVKKEKSIKNGLKNKIYIRMLTKIVDSIDEDIEIVFDKNNDDYDANIINSISKMSKVISIKSGDSQLIPGLQLVDNLCSVIRLKYSDNDANCYFMLIKDHVKEV